MTTAKQSYRLTRGNHHGPDPERPGKLRKFSVGDVVELTEFGAKALADKIEPVNAPDPVAHKAAVKAAAPTVTAPPKAPVEERAKAESNATEGAIELADDEDVELSLVEGTGKGGRILQRDVEAFLEGEASV